MPYEGTFQPGQAPEHVILRETDHHTPGASTTPAARGERVSDPDRGRPSCRLVRRSGSLPGERSRALRSTAATHRPGKSPSPEPTTLPPLLTAARSRCSSRPAVSRRQSPSREPAASSSRLADRNRGRRNRLADSLDFPVNPLPSARLVVDGPASSLPPRFLNPQGAPQPDLNRPKPAELGPADHVEIQWGAAENAGPITGLTVDGVILWDIEPAGDRVQARFTYRGPGSSRPSASRWTLA